MNKLDDFEQKLELRRKRDMLIRHFDRPFSSLSEYMFIARFIDNLSTEEVDKKYQEILQERYEKEQREQKEFIKWVVLFAFGVLCFTLFLILFGS